jgi:hypothetical protein
VKARLKELMTVEAGQSGSGERETDRPFTFEKGDKRRTGVRLDSERMEEAEALHDTRTPHL